MASNIRVVLEVDNKKYIADMRQATQATRQFADEASKNTANVGGAFNNTVGAVAKFGERLNGLKTQLAALGFAAVTRSALQFAETISDLSDSSGIAVARLLEFSEALAVSGGNAEALPNAIARFSQSVEDAANTGGRALFQFEKLGVSLEDIGRISQEDLLITTLEGIAKLESATARSTAMMEMFGKSFRNVAPRDMIERLREARGTQDSYAASVKEAGRLMDSLSLSAQKIAVALINAFGPTITKIKEFADDLNKSETAMNNLVTAIKLVGVALATSFAVGSLRAVVAAIGLVGRGLAIIVGLVPGLTAIGATIAGWFAVFSKFNVVARALATVIGAGFGIYAASQLFDDFGSIARNVFQRLTESVVGFGADIIDLVFIPINKVITLLNKLPGVNISGLDDTNNYLRQFQKQLEASRLKSEELAKSQKSITKAAKEQKTASEEANQAGTDITGALMAEKQKVDAIRQVTIELDRNIQKYRERIQQDTTGLNISDQTREKLEAERDVRNQIQDSIDRLIEKKNNLSREDQKYANIIDEQIAQLKRQQEAQVSGVLADIDARQRRQALARIETLQIRNVIDLENQRASMLGYTLSELEKFNQALRQGDFRSRTEEEIELLRQQAEELDRNAAKYRGMVMARDLQRSAEDFANSIRDQMRMDETRNEAQRRAVTERIRLEGELRTKLREIEDRYQRQGELTEELRQRKAAEIAQAIAGNEALIKSNIALIESDQNRRESFEFGWERAFDNYVSQAQNAATAAQSIFETFTRSLEDAIVNFVQTGKLNFKDLANTIIAEFVRIQARALIAGIFGGVNKSGGGGVMGFFKTITGLAKGGPVMANTPYLVGEQGPEMFLPRSAGQIIPNNRLGDLAPAMSTAVTYNINAVDAASFRQMVSRDPEFIFAVTERGRQALPRR